MLYDNTDFNYEVSLFKIPGNDFKFENSSKFLEPEEGFMRGNLEKDTFVPYKQYTYFQLKAENEQEKMLLKLMALSFAINEMNLYLDLHPEDKDTFEKFKRNINELNNLELNYVKKYGPMVIEESDKEKYDWLKNPWPWDSMGGSMYV